MMSNSAPKLKSGMKAFAHSGNGKYFHLESARVNSRIYPQHSAAFKLAAELTLDAHETGNQLSNNDTLLFPVLYLYRHCLELMLKDLILLGVRTRFFTLDEVSEIVSEHPLCPLWTKVKRFLIDSFPVADDLSIVESVINDFHQIDPNGQILRYERNKDSLRLRTYDKLPSHIGVENLRTTMDRVFEYLDLKYGGILGWWDALQQAQCETEHWV